MNKLEIRQKLREGVGQLAPHPQAAPTPQLRKPQVVKEKQAQPQQKPQAAPTGKTPKDMDPNQKKGYEKEYADIERALDDTILTMSQVMGASGLGDPKDAGDRRAFTAKLYREKTDTGSERHFDDKELAQVAKVVSNPKSYLNKKTVA